MVEDVVISMQLLMHDLCKLFSFVVDGDLMHSSDSNVLCVTLGACVTQTSSS